MEGLIPFAPFVTIVALIMLVWACIEVGSNDAANLVNAVFGARLLKRKQAVNLAGIFVVIGAGFASPVLDTVRRGIFDFSAISDDGALSIFIATYLVNTLLLHACSSFGLPVSSTVILVFSLAGGAIGVGNGLSSLRFEVFSRVLMALALSVVASGISAFILQRSFRYLMRKDCEDPLRVHKYGAWIAGLMLTSILWFLVIEGLKNIPMIASLRVELSARNLWWILIPTSWIFLSFLVIFILRIVSKKAASQLFSFTAIFGMCSLAFSFGQNDLGNCASPGIAILLIYLHGLESGSEMQVPFLALLGCGFLIYLGMRTRRAHRVTKAEISTGSQQDTIQLYAPKWCVQVARYFLQSKKKITPKIMDEFTPEPLVTYKGKKFHYDALRASVILTVNSSVIAFASGFGLPISATYVGFFAVLATGWGDRIFASGQSDLKLARAIWVFFTWFSTSLLSLSLAAFLASFVATMKSPALILCLIVSFGLQYLIRLRSDRHDQMFFSKNLAKA